MESSKAASSAWGIALALILFLGAVARVVYLGAEIRLSDEAYPVALIERHAKTGSFDMNLGDLGMPGYLTTDSYMGSSYHYACLGWNSLVQALPTTWGGGSSDESGIRLRVRAFSAFFSLVGLGLWAWICSRRLGKIGSLAAVALLSFAPVYLQDAHYARPDSFMLAIVLAYAALWTEGEPGLGQVGFAGILLGVGVACKTTLAPLGILPLCLGPARFGKRWAVHAVFSLVAFAATVPAALFHTAKFLRGLQELHVQYTHPFPGLGPLDGGSTYSMAGAYAWAVFGPVAVALLAWGAWTARKAPRALWVFYVVPFIFYTVLFGRMSNFFERSYAPFLPGAFLLVGLGLDALSLKSTLQRSVVALSAILAVAPCAYVGERFVTLALSGAAAKAREAFHREMGLRLAPVPLHYALAFAVPYWIQNTAEADTATRPYALAIIDYGDPWTRRGIELLGKEASLTELGRFPGPFDDLPASTLQFYHEGSIRYVLVTPGVKGSSPATSAAR